MSLCLRDAEVLGTNRVRVRSLHGVTMMANMSGNKQAAEDEGISTI